MTWNPQQYLQFEDQRLRPAIDLLMRVPLPSPRRIVDLGCGTGNVTRLLAQRWPEAQITGVDNSAAMLDRARVAAADLPRVAFVAAELGAWSPAAPVDLVYSNAALHWLPDHATLIARVAGMVAPAGVLAVQMPDNFRAPSHAAIAALAMSPRWRGKLALLVRATPTAPAADYYEWLAPSFTRIDIWTTEYLQALAPNAAGDHPVAAWTKGTWLGPFLAALDVAEQVEFLAAYQSELATAYPLLPEGGVLFPFRRLFIVANR
jgi:trans-aconitate 2-methyltransferase